MEYIHYIHLFIYILLGISLSLVFLVEFFRVIDAIKNKRFNFFDSYALLNIACMLVILYGLHAHLSEPELFIYAWYYLPALIVCFGFYRLFEISSRLLP